MKDFNKKGYLTERDFLNKNEKKIINDVISEIYSEYFLVRRKNFSVESQVFHDNLLKLRLENPFEFGKIYDQFKLNAKLRSIFYSSKFIKKFSKILDVPTEKIFINGFMLRLDAPNDKRNKLDWHQDTPYYKMTYPKMNAGVCWLAITKNSKNNGTLVFIPNSHEKYISNVKSSKKNKFSSENFKLLISKKELENVKNLNQSFGDASFLHMNLKHRSGTNFSKKFRITLACRFHAMEDGFNVGHEIYNYNKNI